MKSILQLIRMKHDEKNQMTSIHILLVKVNLDDIMEVRKFYLAICILNWNFLWTKYSFELKLKEIKPAQQENVLCV